MCARALPTHSLSRSLPLSPATAAVAVAFMTRALLLLPPLAVVALALVTTHAPGAAILVLRTPCDMLTLGIVCGRRAGGDVRADLLAHGHLRLRPERHEHLLLRQLQLQLQRPLLHAAERRHCAPLRVR